MNIEDRLTRLETKFDERWNAHDKRSEESWASLQNEFREIKDIISKMQAKMACEVHAEQVRNLRTRLNWVYAFITGIIASVIGVWWKK